MDISLLLIRLVLAAVFAVAGLAKLADRPGSRQALLNFGVPAWLATPLGTLLPIWELLVAAALLFTRTAWWGAIGALVLLLLFIVGIAFNLSRGRTPDCHCFGQIHSEPIGWPTLVRNGFLALLAAIAVWQGPENIGPSMTAWLTGLTGVQLVGLAFTVLVVALLAAEAWLLLHLLRQNGRLLLRIEALEAQRSSTKVTPIPTSEAPTAAKQVQAGLPVGVQAPTFRLSDLEGAFVSLEGLRAAGKPVFLVFSDPKCGPCIALMPKLADWQRKYADTLTVALVSKGMLKDNRDKSGKHNLANVLMQQDNEVADEYHVHGTPSAVLVLPDGKIGSHIAGGADAIQKLVVQSVTPTKLNGSQSNGVPITMATGPQVGSTAPAFQLPDLDGNTINSSDLLGLETVVLFWNPTCGYCRRMLNDLKAWENETFPDKPKLILISNGTVEANRESGFKSQILSDNGSGVSRQFGSRGTPSAVLVNSKGQIASPLVVGAEKVLALLNANSSEPKQV